MMNSANDLIWILDGDATCLLLYHQTLGLQYQMRVFDNVNTLISEMRNPLTPQPQLLIADPEHAKGPLHEIFSQGPGKEAAPIMFQVLIVSRLDDLELMRSFLKTGARDYLLKPLRPNELVAKVERALCQAANREILILRNDLDGKNVEDLTFREHQLLTVILSRPNRAVTRSELYEAVWSKVMVNRKTLDVHLFNLRRKLRPLGYDIICQQQTFSLVRQD